MKIIIRVLSYTVIVIIILGLVLIFRNCNRRLYEKRIENDLYLESLQDDSLRCNCLKKATINDINDGQLIGYLLNPSPVFVDFVFDNYGVYLTHYVDSCSSKLLMDSAIFSKFGKDFYAKVNNEYDNLVRNKKLMSYQYDVDMIPEYQCSIKNIYDSVGRILKEEHLRNNKNNDSCFYSSSVLIDFIITKKGLVEKVRLLKSSNTKSGSLVLSVLSSLPCCWKPAIKNNIEVDYRMKMYFYVENFPAPKYMKDIKN